MDERMELLDAGKGLLTGELLKGVYDLERIELRNQIVRLLVSAHEHGANIAAIRNQLADIARIINQKSRNTLEKQRAEAVQDWQRQVESKRMLTDFEIGDLIWYQRMPYVVRGKGGGRKEGRLLIERSGDQHRTACLPQNVERFSNNEDEWQRWISLSVPFQRLKNFVDDFFANREKMQQCIIAAAEHHRKTQEHAKKLSQIGYPESEARKKLMDGAVSRVSQGIERLKVKLLPVANPHCIFEDECHSCMKRFEWELELLTGTALDEMYAELFQEYKRDTLD